MATSPDRKTRVRAIALALALLVAATALVGWLLWPRDGRVELKTPQEAGGGAVSLAASFPQPPDPPIRTPHGIAYRDGLIYVSEADAGTIRVFREDGGRVRTMAIPPASGTATAYPTDMAFVSATELAVVDTAARRVVLVDVGSGRVTPFAAKPASATPVQPTAVASLQDDEIAIADGADKRVKVYGLDGEYRRALGDELTPRLTFVTGMAVVGPRELACSDGNAARVLTLDTESGALRRILPEQFGLARAIAPESNGVFWVVDALARHVERWTTDETRTLTVAGDDSALPPEALLSSPRCAVWLKATNRLYVTDPGAAQIKVYNVRQGTDR
jgi:hypothetical protein